MQGLRGSAEDFLRLILIEEERAVPIAMNRVEDRMLGFAFNLDTLGLHEDLHGRLEVTRQVEGISEDRAAAQPSEPTATSVSIGCGLPGCGHRFGQVAEFGFEYAEIAAPYGRVLPILCSLIRFGCRPQRPDRIGELAKGAKGITRLADHPGLGGGRERGGGLRPC